MLDQFSASHTVQQLNQWAKLYLKKFFSARYLADVRKGVGEAMGKDFGYEWKRAEVFYHGKENQQIFVRLVSEAALK